MTQRFPAFYPITNVCIVADAQKCPPSYDLLLRSKDRDGDCDLWRESGMFKRTTRYLCFTRSFIKDNPDNMVLVALQILNERDFPPTGFITIEKTFDTEERAWRKKQLCVKMVNRNSAREAISDIVLLTKTKRPPEGYTLLGEINGISLCYKLNVVPPETQSFNHAANAATTPATTNGASQNKTSLRPAPNPPIAGKKPTPAPRTNQLERTTDASQIENLSINILNGIEFQLNPAISAVVTSSTKLTPSISFRSLNDIENEFNYSFNLEKSVLASSKP